MTTWRLLPGVLAALIAACGGCDDETPAPGTDTGSEVDAPADARGDVQDAEVAPPDAGDVSDASDLDPGSLIGTSTPVPVQPGVSPDGAGDVNVSLDGEARAGRIVGETGFTGVWSHCKDGDLKLYNGVLEACISNEKSNRYEMFKGGGLVDIHLVGTTDEEVFDLYAPRFEWNTIHVDSVEVVRDGSDGGPAVVRGVGTDMPAAYFVGVAGGNLFAPQGVDFVTEYRLGPTDDFVEILTYITNHTGGPVRAQPGDLLAVGSRATVFRQHDGFGAVGNEMSDWIAAYGPGHSFAWVTPFTRWDSISASFGNPPWELTQALAFVQEDGESSAYLGRLVVGDGSLDDVIVRARQLSTQPTGVAREVTVTGDVLEGLLVVVFAEDGTPLTADLTDSNGVAQLTHPNGLVTYEVSGPPEFAPTLRQRDVTSDDTAIEIPGLEAGWITVEATIDGAAVPASVQIRGPVSRDTVSWDEFATVPVPPGDYDVFVGRGPEFDFAQRSVTISAGEVTTITAGLTRVLDTADWLSADFHQHMEPSSDSEVTVRQRLYDNVAEGVEVIVPTDHDVVTDLGPYIDEADLGQLVSTFPGVETSPVLAHSNVYPLPYQPDEPGRGTVSLAVLEDGEPRRRSVPELIAAVRAMPGNPIFQVNHARQNSGLLDLVGYDPSTGPDAVTHSWWSTDFDAFEVVNGEECEQLYDWASLWNFGLTPTGVGSSDSHGIWGKVGEDRTYLYMPGTDVAAVTPEAVRDVVRAGQVVVASSATLEFTDGTLPGSTITGTTSVDLPVRIQSATWSSIDTIHLIINGRVTQSLTVGPMSETLDYEGTVGLTVDEDSWVVLMASGPRPPGPYRPSGQRAYAFNNPIRIDVDGDGFDPPGAVSLDMSATPLCD